MPPAIYQSLKDEIGDTDLARITKILDAFDWDIVSLIESNQPAFIQFMRDEYSMNTRRMYCTNLSRMFRSAVVRNLYPNEGAYDDMLMKWKSVRRAINAEEDRHRKDRPQVWKPVEVLTEVDMSQLSADIYKDIYVLTQKALEMVAQGNAPGAIHYLVQKYVQARTCTHNEHVPHEAP